MNGKVDSPCLYAKYFAPGSGLAIVKYLPQIIRLARNRNLYWFDDYNMFLRHQMQLYIDESCLK